MLHPLIYPLTHTSLPCTQARTGGDWDAGVAKQPSNLSVCVPFLYFNKLCHLFGINFLSSYWLYNLYKWLQPKKILTTRTVIRAHPKLSYSTASNFRAAWTRCSHNKKLHVWLSRSIEAGRVHKYTLFKINLWICSLTTNDNKSIIKIHTYIIWIHFVTFSFICIGMKTAVLKCYLWPLTYYCD